MAMDFIRGYLTQLREAERRGLIPDLEERRGRGEGPSWNAVDYLVMADRLDDADLSLAAEFFRGFAKQRSCRGESRC